MDGPVSRYVGGEALEAGAALRASDEAGVEDAERGVDEQAEREGLDAVGAAQLRRVPAAAGRGQLGGEDPQRHPQLRGAQPQARPVPQPGRQRRRQPPQLGAAQPLRGDGGGGGPQHRGSHLAGGGERRGGGPQHPPPQRPPVRALPLAPARRVPAPPDRGSRPGPPRRQQPPRRRHGGRPARAATVAAWKHRGA